MVVKGLLNLQQQVDAMKSTVPRNSPSDCAKGFPPSPSKTTSKTGTNPHLKHSLLADQADDASDFLSWKEPPQDVCDQMAQEDNQIVQTCSSLTGFRSDPKQQEWNFSVNGQITSEPSWE